MLLHVLEGVFISIQKLEVPIVEAEGGSDVQILSCKVLRQLALKQLLAWLLYTTALQKLPTKHTWCMMCEKGKSERVCNSSFYLSC